MPNSGIPQNMEQNPLAAPGNMAMAARSITGEAGHFPYYLRTIIFIV
jgi:hypothetical protein